MKTLSQQLGARRIDDSTFAFDVDDGWQQGRGAFGGLVVGAMVRAAVVVTDDVARKVRSVTAELLGPVLPGACTLKIERLRQGSGVQAVRVRLLQGENNDELCQAVVVTGKDRPGTPSWSTSSAPAIPDWRTVAQIALEPPLAPVFTQHFNFRVTGAYPYGGAAVASADGFIQAKQSQPSVDAAVIAALADAWWPAALATFIEPRPTATITYALELCRNLDDLDGTLPLFHTARADVAQDGYSVEHRALWTPDGRLVAQNQQLFAIIR